MASPQVLHAVAELVAAILDLVDKPTLAACARVCQNWKEPSLERLWKDMKSPVPLMEVLAPLHATKVNGKTSWLFDDVELFKAKSRRFQSYANRIRTLSYDNSTAVKGVDGSYVAASTFLIFASFCCLPLPGVPLLPNTSVLKWTITKVRDPKRDIPTASIVPFLSSAIETIHLTLHNWADHNNPIQTMLRALTGGTPNLKHLVLLEEESRLGDIEDDDGRWDLELSTWLGSCPRLETVKLPRYWHTTSMVTTLRALPALKAISVNRVDDSCYFPSEESQPVASWLSETAFPTLEKVGLDLPIPETTELVKSSPMFTRITSASIGSQHWDTSLNDPYHQVPTLLITVVDRCQLMTELNLDLNSHPDFEQLPPMTFATFHPLLACQRLQRLSLGTDQPLVLQASDVEEMGERWPNLVYFHTESIIEDPDEEHPSSSMEILAAFAKALPQLRHLGIHVGEAPVNAASLPSPRPHFEVLETLYMGRSSVPGGLDGALEVGFFLARLCPKDLSIKWTEVYTFNTGQLIDDRKKAWQKVKEHFFFAARFKGVSF